MYISSSSSSSSSSFPSSFPSYFSSSSSRSHLNSVGSLLQIQFPSRLFFHGLHLLFSQVSVDTVYPPLLWSSSPSSSSIRRFHVQCLSSDFVLVSSLHMSKVPQSNFLAPLGDIIYLQSLPDVIIPRVTC